MARTFVEIDIEFSSTGASFDSESFDEDAFSTSAFNFGAAPSSTDSTFRFATSDEDILFDSIPALDAVSVTPSVVDPGVSIGIRATVNATIRDFQYPLAGTDYFQGTFFGKLRAIKPSLQGSALRLIRGQDDQTLAEMVTEHYVIESLSRSGDRIRIVAKDILKLTDGDRAQAPAISNGRLSATIDASVTSATLTPTGIGNLEYAASGKLAMGSEIVSYTRSGDTLTITRAQSGTIAEEHEEDDIVQQVLVYDGESPADIIFDLLTEYSAVDPDWCPLEEWQEDIDTYIGRLYSAEIAEPTPVKDLLNEVIVQAGLTMWWDEIGRQVKLKSLRPVTGTRIINEDEMISNTFSFTEQPNKRRSQAWTYFALKNPLENVEETKNYVSGLVTVDASSDTTYGQSAICKNYCRWIAKNNRPAASRLNALLLSRYTDPPRKFSFDLPRDSEQPVKGQGLNLKHHSLQDTSGSLLTAPVVVTSVEKKDGRYRVDCEEMLFKVIEDEELPDGVKLIIIDSDSYNINLRTLYDSLYTSVTSGDEVQCIIEANAKVGSTSVNTPSFDVGDWPSGVTLTLRNAGGRIQGCGGRGAHGFGFGGGQDGGTAFYTRYAISINNFSGRIYGGGGGGGGAGSLHGGGAPAPGGGGSGFNGGAAGGAGASPGGLNSGGSAGFGGGDGGGFGAAGQDGAITDGGDGGTAIDGWSFVTMTVGGTVIGAKIN